MKSKLAIYKESIFETIDRSPRGLGSMLRQIAAAERKCQDLNSMYSPDPCHITAETSLPAPSEDMARLIADSLAEGICVLDREGRMLYTNRSFHDRSGYDAVDLRDRTYFDMIHPEDRERVSAALAAASRGNPCRNVVHRKLAKDGSAAWCVADWSPLYAPDKRCIGILCRDTVVHGRTHAEEAFVHDYARIEWKLSEQNRALRTEMRDRRRSEERYRRIAEAATDYIYTVSLAEGMPVRSASCPVCEAVTGYSAIEFDEDPDLWTAITVDKDRDAVRTHADLLRKGDDPGPIQHRIKRKDGALRWVNRLPVLHHGPDGAVRSYDVLVRDITERKLAEEALRESEARFRQMADLLPQPLYEADTVGILTFANRTGLQMFGYTEEDLRQGIRLIDLLAPEDRDRARTNAQRIRQGEPTAGNEYSALRKDGTSFPAIIFSAPILREGRPAGLRGIVIDITERVQAEEVLRETALKFRQLAEAISEVFFIKDARTRRTLYISPAYQTVWGRSCQSFYDHPESFRECVHPEDRDRVADVLSRQGQGTPTELEYRIIRPDGALRWIRSKTFPVRNPLGVLYRIVGVAEDITERKLAEESIRQHAARFQALSTRLVDVRESERRSIARELHDEIGQLATGLKLGLDLLAQAGGNGTAAPVANLQVMAAELISSVRNLSLGLRPSMLDDLGLLPALAWLFKRSEEQTGITVNFTHRGIDRRFSSETETVVYRAVQEAITNTARHADADAISVDIAADAGEISLFLSDRGAGFRPDQVLSSPQSTGLFGMRERVDSVGGALNIVSAPGAGTTIAIRLPFSDGTSRETGNDNHDHYS